MQVGFCGLLTLLFVAAKLFGAVQWSWWMVFCPVWIPLAIAAVISLLAVIALGLKG